MLKMLNFERLRELEKWLLATNTRLTQVNGQRKYGGPPEGKSDASAPPHATPYYPIRSILHHMIFNNSVTDECFACV